MCFSINVRADSDGRCARTFARWVLGETIIIRYYILETITLQLSLFNIYMQRTAADCSRTRLVRQRFIASRYILFSVVKRVMKNIWENDENITSRPARNMTNDRVHAKQLVINEYNKSLMLIY
jgi:hypothetical protein